MKPISVESLDPVNGKNTPLRFQLGERLFEVRELLDSWQESDHKFYKVRADDGDVYILRHDLELVQWDLAVFSRADYLDSPLDDSSPRSTCH